MHHKITLKKRLPGFMWFWLVLVSGLSMWLASDVAKDRSVLANNFAGIAILIGSTGLLFALHLSHRVSYDEHGIYIVEGGLTRLLGLQREQFIAFSDVESVDVEFYRGGGDGGLHELLQFGHLRLWPKSEQDERELAIHQMLVNRPQLVELLYLLKSSEPSAVDERLIDAFVSGI